MAAQTARPEFVTVTDVELMTHGNFLRHCRERHTTLPFITRHEHEQDHRLHKFGDHTHTNMQPEAADGSSKEPPTRTARRRSSGANS
jgi:uncharacterized protein involved in copper resistance